MFWFDILLQFQLTIFVEKAPGKLDLKQFHNLSDAIGRLTLNSPGLPLGPTRAGAHSSFDADYLPSAKVCFYLFILF